VVRRPGFLAEQRCRIPTRWWFQVNPGIPVIYHRLAAVLFWGWYGLVLFYALRPSPHGERISGLPTDLGQWIIQNDGWSNTLALALLAWLGLCLKEPMVNERPDSAGDTRIPAKALRHRLEFFIVLVPLLEVAQLWIPGRACDPMDVVAGWLGVGCAWFMWRATSRITKKMTFR